MRTVAVVSVGRSDYGIYQPVLAEIARRSSLRPVILAGGMHLSPDFGNTISAIEEDGYEIAARVDMQVSGGQPTDIAHSISLGVAGFAEAFARVRPDVALVLGDRFEMFSAAAAAVPLQVPLAHLHGGEATEGAFDDVMRHAITKLSHLHFVSTEEYGRRVRQMGEEARRVFVTGAPALDHLAAFEPLGEAEVARATGVDWSKPFVVVTYHPVTLEPDLGRGELTALLEVLERERLQAVITYPNADTGGREFIEVLQTFARGRPEMHLVASLGTSLYYTLLSRAAAMVGNSSSGIIEAASFALPVVNIGTRQQGRARARNVIDVRGTRDDIGPALAKALSTEFRATLRGMSNPYGDGRAAQRIADVLEQSALDRTLLLKHFADL